MQFLLSILVLLVFAFIWYRPLVNRQQACGGYITKKEFRKAVFYGLIPGAILLLLIEVGVGYVIKFLGLNDGGLLNIFLDAFIMYALVEELVKYFCAAQVIKGKESLKRIDIMVVFASVGLGYEVIETLFMGNLIASISRGIFVAHMAYQLIMAYFYCESLKAKSLGDEKKAKNMKILTFVVPIVIHGINDFCCKLIGFEGLGIDETLLTIICVLGLFLLQLICLIVGLKFAKIEPDSELSLN